jgi:hypothetical protein
MKNSSYKLNRRTAKWLIRRMRNSKIVFFKSSSDYTMI